MSVRLIAGRAGSGKTTECLKQIAEELLPAPAEGPRLVLLVPDQAALQMDRALLTVGGLPVLGRCEVLSFRRLARRILQESGAPGLTTLSPLARQMALRLLIGRNARRLREFKSVAERSGFVAGLASTMTELLQESVSVDELDAAAAAAQDAGDPTAPRLHDLALLYRAYLDYLGDSRVDPEGVLDLARARVASLDWIAGCRIWIDGFAGLTRQQSRMIVTLAQHAAAVNIALLLDPHDRRAIEADQPPDDWSLFARTERTWFSLSRQLAEAGVMLEPPLRLGMDTAPRFASDSLAMLERRLFFHDRSPEALPAHRVAGPPADNAVRLVRASTRRVEVDAAVNALVDLVHDEMKPMRLRDIAIIVRDLGPYHDLISAALAERGIPYFIDHRRETTHHPLVELVRAALAIHADPRRFGDAAILLLKTGLIGLDAGDCDALENYILAHGFHDLRRWAASWTHPVDPDAGPARTRSQAEIDALAAINAARSRLVSMIQPWCPIDPADRPASLPAKDWIARLYQLMERLDVRARLSDICRDAEARRDLDAIEEHEQVWRDLMALFDDMVAALGEEMLAPRRLREVLESALGEFTLGLVPPTLDQILVGSIERSRHPSVRAVFVLGFGDGQFPGTTSESAVLGDDERAVLAKTGVELTQSRVRRMLDERMLAYIALTRASERLWISHPAADERGRPLAPSPYWDGIRAILPTVVIEDIDGHGLDAIGSTPQLAGRIAGTLRAVAEERVAPDAAVWTAAYDWARTVPNIATRVASALRSLAPALPATLAPTAVAALWPPPYDTSVTRLEEFAQCPFRHHLTHGLRLRPRAEADVSPVQMGRLYHAVLEQFVNELAERQEGLRDLDASDIAERLQRLTAASLEHFGRQVFIDPADVRQIERRGHFELLSAIRGERAHLDKTQLAPHKTEQVFGMGDAADLPALRLPLPDGRVVTVRGKIDRVDLLPAGKHTLAVVFDYKRKLRQRLRLDEAYHGLSLQLLTYLLVIRDGNLKHEGVQVVPGGAFYLPLLGSYTSVDHPDEADDPAFRPFAPYKPRGVLDFDWIDQLDPKSTEKSGWSEVFQLFRKKRDDDDDGAEGGGDLGNIESSDAVPAGALSALLDRTRETMTELAERWLDGDIRVLPARRGHDIACSNCSYQGICRIETATRQTRPLETLSRQEVIDRVTGTAPPLPPTSTPVKKKKGGRA